AAKVAKRYALLRANVAWLIAALLAVIAVGEAIWIARTALIRPVTAFAPPPPPPVTIESQQPGDQVIVDGRDVGVTPITLPIPSEMRSIRVHARPSLDAAVGQLPAIGERPARAGPADRAPHA